MGEHAVSPADAKHSPSPLLMLANDPAGVPDDTALISVADLAGTVTSEVELSIGCTIEELKKRIRHAVAPHASESARLMLLFDGSEPDDRQTLHEVGIPAREHTRLTALIYDLETMVKGEVEDSYQQAVERSRQEAVAERKARAEQRQKMLEQRRRQIGAEEPTSQGPPLMLTDGASAPEPAAAVSSSTPLLMLADEAPSLAATEPKAACPAGVAVVAPAVWRPVAAEIVAAYGSFFDHISFRKVWKDPPFTRAEVTDCFEAAARVVALTRLEILDQRDTGIKLRQVEGSARDWMHGPVNAPLLRDSPDRFVAGLVHATLKDAHGYVEGLCEQEVDQYIERYRA